MLSGIFASPANQVSRNRKDSEHMSAGFEHSGHFKGYLLSLESLLVIFLRKKLLTADQQIILLLRNNYCFHTSVHHLSTISTRKFWVSVLIDLFHTDFQKGRSKAQMHYETLLFPGSTPSASNLDHKLKNSTWFWIHFSILKNQPAALLQSLLPEPERARTQFSPVGCSLGGVEGKGAWQV